MVCGYPHPERKTLKATFKAIIASLLLAAPAAQAVILDFEEPAFTNGLIVDNEYFSAHGVTISAINAKFDPDLAVIFDTTPSDSSIATLNTASDPDLMGTFSSINGSLSQSHDPGNILIIQDNNEGCDAASCARPDDQAGTPAGLLRFEFQQAIDLLSLDFFDVENNENNDQPGSEILFYDNAGVEKTFATNYFVPDTGGDNKWNRLAFAGVTGIYRIDVHLRGSGGIDRLEFNVVPVPASVWLFGTALVGFIGFARRRSI